MGGGGSNDFQTLGVEDVPSAAAVLASAFEHDPFYSWLIPDPTHRVAGLTEYFAAKLTHVLTVGSTAPYLSPSGGTILIGEHVAAGTGVATDTPALPPHSRAVLRRWVSPRQLDQIAEVFEAMPHPQYDHVYLDILATAPSAQGSGEGSALARFWLDSIRGETRHVHLDSSSAQNIPFYERLGFSAGPAVALPHGAGRLTPMDLEFP